VQSTWTVEKSGPAKVRLWTISVTFAPAAARDAGKVRETAGAICNQCVETVDASVGSKPALNDTTVREGINIATGKHQDDPLANEIWQRSFEKSRESGSTCTFDNAFIQLCEAKHSQRQRLFADGYQFINQPAANGKGLMSSLGHGKSVSQCVARGNTNRLSRSHPSGETSSVCRLNSNNPQPASAP
jgi:hypothetical protein